MRLVFYMTRQVYRQRVNGLVEGELGANAYYLWTPLPNFKSRMDGAIYPCLYLFFNDGGIIPRCNMAGKCYFVR